MKTAVNCRSHLLLLFRGISLNLHAAIDDATNEVPWTAFREHEDATGHLILLHHIRMTHGLPVALCAVRHTFFQSPKVATFAEQVAGLEPRSHLGRLLDPLDIHLIVVRSPSLGLGLFEV